MDCDAALEIAARIFESGEAVPDQNAIDLLFVFPLYVFHLFYCLWIYSLKYLFICHLVGA